MENYPDSDYIPVFGMCDTGEVVIPTMFGAQYVQPEDQTPWCPQPLIKNLAEEVDRLSQPDPYKDGLVAYCLERLRFFLEATDYQIPCSYLDHRSPLGIAEKLLGAQALMIEMYDHPQAVKKLLDLLADTIIDVMRAQEEVAGSLEHLVATAGMPSPHKALLWDDLVSVVSPKLYLEFCKEPNERILRAFGGGHFHTCGPVLNGQVEGILALQGVCSFDCHFVRRKTRTLRDLLELKERTKGKLIYRGALQELQSDSIELDPKSQRKVSLELLRQMNEKGGFIWDATGDAEEGKRLSELAKAVVNQ